VSGGVYQIGGAVLPVSTGDYSFQLRSGGAVIERLGDIVGSNFNFQRVQTTFQFNPIDTSGNIILGSSINLADDAAVVFTADSSSLVRNIANLDLGQTYYIQNVLDASGNSIGVRLKNNSGTVINFDASLADGSFSLSGVSPVQVAFNSQNIRASTLNLTGSGFQVDDQVRYTTDVQDLDALQTGDYFVKTVTTVNGNNSIQLSRTLGGSVETFEATTGGGTSSVALISRAGGVEADTITSAAHGFQNGDAVKYTSSSIPNEIGGLDTGRIYYVVGRDASGNSFKLSETLNGNPIDLTSAGVSTQTFAKATVFSQPSAAFSNGNQVIYDGIASSGAALSGMTVGSTYTVHLPNGGSSFQLLDSSGNVVSSTGTGAQLFRTTSQQSYVETNAITIASHGFQNGDVIKYGFTGGSQIGNLPTSGTYYARDVSGNTFRLASTSGGAAIDLSSSGSGTQTFTKAAVFNQPATPYIQDALVIYDGNAGGSNIGGLTVGSTYKVHLVNGNNSFQLLDASGNYVATTSFGTGTPLFRNADQLPYVQTDTITIANHGFQNGDAITYSSANPITNLSNNGTYYVRDVSGNEFKLSTSAGGSVRDLTGYGSGTQSFAKGTVFSQPSTAFSNGSQVVYGGADASGNAITGLTLNATYTVHNIGNGSSFQLIDGNNKVVNISDEGIGNQIFNTASSSLYLQSHGFSVGDQITYGGATGAGSSDIGNLPRATYTVKAVTTDTFQLENPTNSSAAISFTSAGSGTHEFTSGAGGPISAASVTAAIQTNARYTAELGSEVNALNFAIDSMETLSSNLAQAYSRIMDVDYASETAALTRNQILQQAATSMLAQANQMPNVILTLLK
jgi:flagellin-like hook-associated protein FlgL